MDRSFCHSFTSDVSWSLMRCKTLDGCWLRCLFVGSLLGNSGMKHNKMDGYSVYEFPFFSRSFFFNEVYFVQFICLFICWGMYEVKSSMLGRMFGIPFGTVAFCGFKLSTMAVAPERNSVTREWLIRLQNFQGLMGCLGFVCHVAWCL